MELNLPNADLSNAPSSTNLSLPLDKGLLYYTPAGIAEVAFLTSWLSKPEIYGELEAKETGNIT
jgi:hypothetical protein